MKKFLSLIFCFSLVLAVATLPSCGDDSSDDPTDPPADGGGGTTTPDYKAVSLSAANLTITVDNAKDAAWSGASTYNDPGAGTDAWESDNGATPQSNDPVQYDFATFNIGNDGSKIYFGLDITGTWGGRDVTILIDKVSDSAGLSNIGDSSEWDWDLGSASPVDKNIVMDDDTTIEGIIHGWEGSGTPGHSAFTYLNGTGVKDATIAEFDMTADLSFLEASITLTSLGLTSGDKIRVIVVGKSDAWSVANIYDSMFDGKLTSPWADQAVHYAEYTLF